MALHDMRIVHMA